jgi:hypothetical protein
MAHHCEYATACHCETGCLLPLLRIPDLGQGLVNFLVNFGI